MPFAQVSFEILKPILSYAAYIFDSITVQSFNGLYLVAENTSRTLLSQSVLNVDKCLKAYIAK